MPLILKNICKKFGEKIIFDNFSYDFKSTGIYGLQGDSGRGKTTLLRIISGLDKDFKGEITGNENISYAFQEYRLFPSLSALDNVIKIAYSDADENEVNKSIELLKTLRFSDYDLHLYPTELSGGMKQRINFARALLKESKILLLDEITKEVDKEIKDIMLRFIKEASLSRLVILISHNSEDLEALGAEIISL